MIVTKQAYERTVLYQKWSENNGHFSVNERTELTAQYWQQVSIKELVPSAVTEVTSHFHRASCCRFLMAGETKRGNSNVLRTKIMSGKWEQKAYWKPEASPNSFYSGNPNQYFEGCIKPRPEYQKESVVPPWPPKMHLGLSWEQSTTGKIALVSGAEFRPRLLAF